MFRILTKSFKKGQLSSVDGVFFVGVAAVVFSIVVSIMWHTTQVHENYMYTTTLWFNGYLLEKAAFSTGYPTPYGISLLKNSVELSPYKLENLSQKNYDAIAYFYGIGEDNFYISVLNLSNRKNMFYYGNQTNDNNVITRKLMMYKGHPVLVRVVFERKPRR